MTDNRGMNEDDWGRPRWKKRESDRGQEITHRLWSLSVRHYSFCHPAPDLHCMFVIGHNGKNMSDAC